MLKVIVVPLDGSPFSEQVLPLAMPLAERHHADVELVHVFEALPPYFVQGAPSFDAALDEARRRDRQEYLESVAERLRRDTALNVFPRILAGPGVVTTLIGHLIERRADLVVMATHGRGGFSRLWIGSVTTGVVRRSETPMLLARPDTSREAELQPPSLRRVLIPLDATPVDEDAIEDAIAVANPTTAEFHLLHVAELLQFLRVPAMVPRVQADVEAAMSEHLEQLARRIRARGFAATTEVHIDASPARVILEVAEKRQVNLIVMEANVRTGVSHRFGGVTDKVVRGARAPVLVHRRRVEGVERTTATTAETAAESWRMAR